MKKYLYSIGIIALMSVPYVGIWANTALIVKLLSTIIFGVLTIGLCCYKKWHKAIIAVVGIALLLICPLSQLYVIYSLAIWTITVFVVSSDSGNSIGVFPLVWTSVYVLFEVAILSIPAAWNAVDIISRKTVEILTFGSGLGSSISGFIPLISSIIATIIVALSSRTVNILLRLIPSAIIYIVSLNIITSLLQSNIVLGTNLIFLLVVLPGIAYGKLLALPTVNMESNSRISRKVGLVVVAIVLILMVGMDYGVILGTHAKDKRTSVSTHITLVNMGEVADMSAKPRVDGPYGFGNSTFTFTALPKFIELNKYKYDFVDSIEKIDYKNTDAVVLFHYDKISNESIVAEMTSFVEEGGILFVLCDHHNLFDSAVATNILLEPFGLEINNDISDSLLHNYQIMWENGLTFYPTYFTSHIDTPSQAGVFGGASVSTKNIWAVPIIIGKYGTSDPANMEAGLEGGYLGNRAFDIGESAGDIPLMYSTVYGKGSVVAFGDGSYGQLPGNIYNWEFISKLLSRLNDTGVYINEFPLSQIIKLLALCIIIAMTLAVIIKNQKLTVYVLSGTIIGVIAFSTINIIKYSEKENMLAELLNYDVISIDMSRENGLSDFQLDSNSITGLGYAIQKKGIQAIADYQGDVAVHTRMNIIINPKRVMNLKEKEELVNYMESGGTVILCGGRESIKSCSVLTQEFGITLDRFAGPLPWRNPNVAETMDSSGPNFKMAWNQRFNTEITEAFYEYRGYVPVTVTQVGKGRLYVISDSDFFFGDNLESEMTGNEYNIEFLYELIENEFPS